jgi:hypothetical protein
MNSIQQPSVDYSQLQYLRQVLAPQYAILPTAQIQALMASRYGRDSAEAYDAYLEGFFDDLSRGFSSAVRDVGRVAQKVAPVVATVGGGAVQGALSGAQFGLPGIIAGAALGGAGAGLSRYGGGGAAGTIGNLLTGVTNLAGQTSPLGRLGGAIGPAISGLAGGGRGGAAGAAVSALNGILGAVGGGGAGGGLASAAGALLGGGGGGGPAGGVASLLGRAAPAAGALAGLFGGSGAAGQLLSFLQRPETGQALGALNLGALGRGLIPVGAGQTQVPTAAFPRLLAQLADQAVTEAAGWSGEAEGELAYMMDQEGAYVGDPALERDRSARLWMLMQEAQAERVLDALLTTEAPGDATDAESEQAETEAWERDEGWYDAVELAEAYAAEAEAAAYLDAESAEAA